MRQSFIKHYENRTPTSGVYMDIHTKTSRPGKLLILIGNSGCDSFTKKTREHEQKDKFIKQEVLGKGYVRLSELIPLDTIVKFTSNWTTTTGIVVSHETCGLIRILIQNGNIIKNVYENLTVSSRSINNFTFQLDHPGLYNSWIQRKERIALKSGLLMKQTSTNTGRYYGR